MLFDNNTVQQKSQNKIETWNKDASFRSFDVNAADALRNQDGVSTLRGADAAMLTAQKNPTATPRDEVLIYQEASVRATTRSEDTDTGVSGFFGRLFSRNVSFNINGTPIIGTNGHQVRGNTVPLMPGAALDLAPATLTGHYSSKTEQSAEGSGAYLYVAPVSSSSLLQQRMADVSVNSAGNIKAKGVGDVMLPVGVTNITLGASVVQQDAKGGARVRFPVNEIEFRGDTITDLSAEALVATAGVCSISQLGFTLDGTKVTLNNTQVTNGRLSFNMGVFRCKHKGAEKNFRVQTDTLDLETLKEEIGNAKNVMEVEAVPPPPPVPASLKPPSGPKPKGKTAPVPPPVPENLKPPPEPKPKVTPAPAPAPAPPAAPTVPAVPAGLKPPPPPKPKTKPAKPAIPLPETINHGQVRLIKGKDIDPENGEYEALVVMNTPLSIRYLMKSNFGEVAFRQRTLVTVNKKGEVSADLEDVTLEQDSKEFEIGLAGVKIANSELKAEKLSLALTNGLEGENSENSQNEETGKELTQDDKDQAEKFAIGFEIPECRYVYRNVLLSEEGMSAKFNGLSAPAIKASYKDYSLAVDFEKRTLSFSYTKQAEESPLEKAGVKWAGYAAPPIPLIPGLASIQLSIEPDSSLEGEFGVEGTVGRSFFSPNGEASEASLAGTASFSVGASVRANADLELGLASMLTAYGGFHAEAGTEFTLDLMTGLTIEKDEKNAYHFKELALGGEFEAVLKGSIGAHLGVRVLIYKANLIEHTFKEWQLGSMTMSAEGTKDLTKSALKGWNLQKSSFTLEGFNGAFSKNNSAGNRYNIESAEEELTQSMVVNSDYENIEKELRDVVAHFEEIKKSLEESAKQKGVTTMIDMEFINEQAAILEGVYQRLKEQGKTLQEQGEILIKRLRKLKADLLKEEKDKKEGAQKHADRLAFYQDMQEALDSSSTMGYKGAVKSATEKRKTRDWRRKAEEDAIKETGAYERLVEHEEKQVVYYTSKRNSSIFRKDTYQEGVTKHRRRLLKLMKVKQDAQGALRLRQLATYLDEGETSKEYDAIASEVRARVRQKKAPDTESDGWHTEKERLDEENAGKGASTGGKRHQKALDELAQRIAYEQSRAEVYSVSETADKITEMEAQNRKTAALVNTYRGIESVFTKGTTLKGNATQSGQAEAVANMLAYINDTTEANAKAQANSAKQIGVAAGQQQSVARYVDAAKSVVAPATP